MTLKEVFNPKSIEEIVEIIGKYGNEAKLIAGGTDIMIQMKNEIISPSVLIDISKVEELKKIEELGEHIFIGAGTTFTEIVDSELFKGNLKGMNKAARMVGSPQIRNKGTIGGNIANGSAAADIVPPLLCLEAILVLESLEGKREITLEDYYNDKIESYELLTYIKFKKPSEERKLSFAKLGLRRALAISRLTNSVLIELDQDKKIKFVRAASGALAKNPVREYEVESYLMGKRINDESIEGATQTLRDAMAIRLKGRSTLPYKSEAINTSLREALELVGEMDE